LFNYSNYQLSIINYQLSIINYQLKQMIAASELILNPDGSVYHINLKPGQIA